MHLIHWEIQQMSVIKRNTMDFFVLSDDGNVYRVKFKPISTDENDNEQQATVVCFPLYVHIYIDKTKEFILISIENKVKTHRKLFE